MTTKRKRELINGGDPDAKFIIPGNAEFAGDDFLLAEPLAEIGEALIASVNNMSDLQDATIVYLWKEKGSTSPRRLLGKCQRPSGLLSYFSKADFVVWLAANNCLGMTKWAIEALVFHELQHAGMRDGEYVVLPHDCECFASEIERYGFWKRDIERIAVATGAIMQLPFEEIAPAAPAVVRTTEVVQ
jgi:hypothetical protein